MSIVLSSVIYCIYTMPNCQYQKSISSEMQRHKMIYITQLHMSMYIHDTFEAEQHQEIVIYLSKSIRFRDRYKN